MKSRRLLRAQARRITCQRRLMRLAVMLLCGVGAAALIAVIARAAVFASGSPPSSKQIARQQLAAQATAISHEPHAAKHPQAAVTSCPRPAMTPAVMPPGYGPTDFHQNIVNTATAVPTQGMPYDYMLYAGSLATNPQQGILIIMRFDKDPCKPGASGTFTKVYDTPYQQGALTLTQVSGDTVTFSTATGGIGHFDYVTGQFS